jgi:DNA helicase-2/ATP-dependent DNA helicase PcrA
MTFEPTPQQLAIIDHEGPAFVSACPGAGKTRVIVERARRVLSETPKRVVAFLSFTHAAVTELEVRLRANGLFGHSTFPTYVGTFDSFLWQFLLAPFGLPGFQEAPRLVPDLETRMITPYPKAHPLPLDCFDREGNAMLATAAKAKGFDKSAAATAKIQRYETAAASLRTTFRNRGLVDFDSVRDIAASRIVDASMGKTIGRALAGRFSEIVIDEAQDCNPRDLAIIEWLRGAGLRVLLVCDPEQAIYGFRGGVTDELRTFRCTFNSTEQLPLTGNFRSSQNICNAIATLRTHAAARVVDQALGDFKNDQTPVYVLSYAGAAVSPKIGPRFAEIVAERMLRLRDCPLVAATKQSSAAAIGQPALPQSNNAALNLGSYVTEFHFGFETGSTVHALEQIHRVVLRVEGHLRDATYHEYLVEAGIENLGWRSRILRIAKELRFDSSSEDGKVWLKRAQALLKPGLIGDGGTIGQRLKYDARLEIVLAAPSASIPLVRTIHSVKGEEFPGICVVMTRSTARNILDYLEASSPANLAEEARKIYVGASRAQRLLVMAVPKAQAARLILRLKNSNVTIVQEEI